MRRSIAICNPSVAHAGQRGTWSFHYTTATPLPKGTALRFDILSEGRPTDWEIPSADSKKKKNVIYLELESKKRVYAEEIFLDDAITPVFEFILPEEVDVEESFTIFIGKATSSSSDNDVAGNACQCTLQRRRPFHLRIDTKGKGNFSDPEMFTLDVKGGKLAKIRAITPSFVVKNKRFDVILRFEDEFGNLTSNTEEGTLIEVSYDQLRENLNWKLFIPETGYLAIPNLYFNEPGVYRLKLRNLKTGETFTSSPIKCFAEETHQLFWGLLHGESEKYDTSEDIEPCLRHLRDERALNFFSTSNIENADETPNSLWKHISGCVAQFNEEDRFVSLLGFQWQGEPEEEGLRQFIYSKDNKPLARKKDSKSNMLKKIYRTHSPKDLLSIPMFTGTSLSPFNFEEFNPEFERVVEIYNAWGSSECTAKQGNPFPIQSKRKQGAKTYEPGTLLAALGAGHRFGFVAGGLDDRGAFEHLLDEDQPQYAPGLTAILADTFTRDGLISALQHRKCYATTGVRTILGFELAGHHMGSELSLTAKPGLAFNRHLSGFVVGTAPISKIEIIRCGKVLETISGASGSEVLDYSYDDMDKLDKISLAAGANEHPFVYYYVRVTQEDGNVAWSSPIWIDLDAAQKGK
jgi:hypothetical protein